MQLDDSPIREFMMGHTCYDILPISAKIIAFDVSLPLKKAFFAMLQNEIKSAPLWDSELQCITGMLTVTDFVNILSYYYHHPQEAELSNLDDHIILTWKKKQESMREVYMSPNQLIYLSPMKTTYEAAKIMIDNRIHRIPLIQEELDEFQRRRQRIVGVITQAKVLKFIAMNFVENLSYFNKTIRELGIGTFSDIASAKLSTPLIEVLDLFQNRRVSAIPILDDQNILVDVYEKNDVTYLARDGAINDLRMSVEEALKHRIEDMFEGVHTCSETDTLTSLLDTIQTVNFHRLWVVDENKKLLGVVSVSDVLGLLLTATDY